MEKYSQFRDRGIHARSSNPLLSAQDHPKFQSLIHTLRTLLGLTWPNAKPGSSVAPFLPIPREPSGLYLPLHITLFIIRVPLVLALTLAYCLIFYWMPVGSFLKKASLWSILGVPGIWWIDIQIDGVKRG